jgi:inner membrane protein
VYFFNGCSERKITVYKAGCSFFELNVQHILIDACTNYGTGWFEPFSHARISFNTFCTGSILYYCIAWIIHSTAILALRIPSRKNWLYGGLASVALTWCLVHQQGRIDRIFEKSLNDHI